ncbi:MAG: hypothetical protein WA159_17260 [Variovorax sp.]
MNATATATRPRTRKPSAPIVPAKPFWYAPSLAARTAILEALAAALDHEFEDDDRTSDAWRVAKAAHASAEAIVVDGFPPHGESDLMFRNDIAASAFDVRAFLTAALNYPGQPFCADRSVHLVRAHRIADALAALNVAGPDQSMVAEVYAAIENRASTARPEPAKTAVARVEIDHAPASGIAPAEGLNAAQCQLILETITGRARTLESLLMLLQDHDLEDAYQQAVLIDAAAALATMIGAMADDATGGAIHGDAHYWNYGPDFATTGKAVQA